MGKGLLSALAKTASAAGKGAAAAGKATGSAAAAAGKTAGSVAVGTGKVAGAVAHDVVRSHYDPTHPLFWLRIATSKSQAQRDEERRKRAETQGKSGGATGDRRVGQGRFACAFRWNRHGQRASTSQCQWHCLDRERARRPQVVACVRSTLTTPHLFRIPAPKT